MQPPVADSEAFDRFKAIYAALNDESIWWESPTWLRFAAQAAVLIPGDARTVAGAIREFAATFRADTGWLEALHSPFRFMVAALLVQAGDTPAAFEAELKRCTAMFHDVGISHRGMPVIIAVLLLRLSGNRPVTWDCVVRMQAIYQQLKRLHWWLTGPHDLPTCAMLVGLPGSPEEVARIVEDHYHRLSAGGFQAGVQLEQAAHILPMLRLQPEQAVRRYSALAQRYTTHGTHPWRRDYEAIAVLCFLDEDPEEVASMCLALYRKLGTVHPVLHHEILIDLAADLTVLDHFGRRLRLLLPDGEAHKVLLKSLRDEQCAAAVIACFGVISIDPTTY